MGYENGATFKKRLAFIQRQLAQHQVSVVNRWGLLKKEVVAVERFFNNDRVKVEILIEELKSACSARCPSGHVLLLQDSSELNYHGISGRLKVNDPDIGVLSDDRSTGICIHPGLSIGASSELPIGYAHLGLYSNTFGRIGKKERDYKHQPIEQKQSYRWIEAIRAGEVCLAQAEQITVISDRESDIYELLAGPRDIRTELLIRSSWDRRVVGDQKLSEYLQTQPWQATIAVKVKATRTRSARTAHLNIRWTQIQLCKPKNKKQLLKAYPDSVPIGVVEIEEQGLSVPQGEQPIHWRLFTTHRLENLTDAKQVVQWYTQRWWIEELFRLIKTKGFQVESSQFATGAALKKIITLTLEQALKVMIMKQGREGKEDIPASICFSQEEQQVLQLLQGQVEGSTQKQQNPFSLNSLAWAAWIIARLGGWTPVNIHKRPPGVITFIRGIKKFNQLVQGWKLAMTHYEKLYKSPNKSP